MNELIVNSIRTKAAMKNIVYIILAIAIIGCQKKQTEIPVNANLMKAYGFNLGTYWIYYDSVSNETDSFVISQKPELVQSPFYNGATKDYWEYYIAVYNNGNDKYSFGVSLTDSELNLSPNIFYNSNEQHTQFLFFYPQQAPHVYYYSDSESVIKINSNYFYNGNTFNNVCSVNCFRNYSPDSNTLLKNDWFYFSDQVGFVKIVINSPTDSVYKNWNLLRYHVQF